MRWASIISDLSASGAAVSSWVQGLNQGPLHSWEQILQIYATPPLHVRILAPLVATILLTLSDSTLQAVRTATNPHRKAQTSRLLAFVEGGIPGCHAKQKAIHKQESVSLTEVTFWAAHQIVLQKLIWEIPFSFSRCIAGASLAPP